MQYNSRRISINFTDGKGFDEHDAILIIASMLKALKPGRGIDFDRNGAEYTCVGLNPDTGKWMVSFRPHAGDHSRRHYYDDAIKAATAIYYKRHNYA
jgi:hypothetical protein